MGFAGSRVLVPDVDPAIMKGKLRIWYSTFAFLGQRKQADGSHAATFSLVHVPKAPGQDGPLPSCLDNNIKL